MNYDVFVSEQAEQDLNEIYSYIYCQLKSKISAERIAQRLNNAMVGLSEMPKRYRLYSVEPWLSRGIRSVRVGNYSIFYLVDDAKKIVLITRIAYRKRNMETVLR